jgi:light-regulated signal transduction histidine kinase (bacteriophytochrome)
MQETQQFLQSAVHDLRAAQRSTGIASEMLLQAQDDEARKDLAKEISHGLAKTNELLSGIARYANALVLNRQRITVFPAARAVRAALANLDREIRDCAATIEYGDLPEISADSDRIAEVFEALLSNSLKFRGPDAPVIRIEATELHGFWKFTIRDNGVGIPTKYRDRLFTPFRRLHGADVAGVGLGLAISRKIIESHGGEICFEEADGPGVPVSFTLPTDGFPRA